MKKPLTLTAVLFVGGESRRMGSDKAMVEFFDKPLWSRQLQILRELNPEKILISAREHPIWRPPEIEVVLDEPPSHGPLSGLDAAFRRLQTTHLLALAIDLPLMTVTHLQNLWALTALGCGLVPQSKDFFEPLCAIYPAEAGAAARNAFAQKKLSLQVLVQDLVKRELVQVYSLTELDRPLYRNANTPEDLEFIA